MTTVPSMKAVEPAVGERPRTRKRSALRKPLAWLISWGALFALWEALAAALGPELLPRLGSVLTNGVSGIVELEYPLTVMESMWQMLLGFLIAAAVTIPLGALMGASRIWNDLIEPYALGIYVTPREALLPMLILIFGTDASFRIAIVILFSAYFPLVNTAVGVREVVRGPLAEMARSICTSRWHMFVSVLVPGALPYMVAGLRLGLGMAFNGIVIAELWTSVGAGGALTSLASYRQLPEYFALAGLVAVLAVTSYSLLGLLEQRLRVRFGQP